jgi:Carboxypeptidase regulatory-like domain
MMQWLLVLICVAVFGRPLYAQTGLRTLTGSVTDKSHEPLKGAVVQLHNEVTGDTISYLSTATGTFDFKRLSPSQDYTVWATYRGHKSKVESMSRFDSKADKVVALVIELD